MNIKKLFPLLLLIFLSVYLSSCATVPPPQPVIPAPAPSIPSTDRRTTIHSVAPGETIWRISKMYNVPTSTILQTNHLRSTDALKMGQKLKIPGATKVQPVISLYRSHKWKYIIIHHSATREGNSLAFNNAHLRKGWDRGVGYHFIIDRRASGKQDGQIETSPRWLKQEDGAHCKADDMNPKAIGICLVGDFDHDYVTPKQMDSLIELVNTLKEYYKIPNRNIIRHGHVPGAQTHCPGKKFPWQSFLDRIKAD